ncbi:MULTISPECIES: TOBE domain-containing protein [Pseudanabaena]|jgi:molybdopterin-binding protein|uniref:TOBE domain-containing protein n=1 Tax=Pseudanabaena TaxID=1152 RepID=UPI00247AF6DF|nr:MULTISPECIES: molybdopterin-binding protein [Pseudanabaena]MEA5490006.1 molybdopterin-binding protein [Pseudanabaena sp. CCNP1317]WGS73455.1 molybdopterin-binding protein [Pseudanabaena galeata CCNP1313]
MKISARNSFKGIVKKITIGAVNAEISIEISSGVEITSIITKSSAEALGLQEGSEAYAVVKASDVMVAID